MMMNKSRRGLSIFAHEVQHAGMQLISLIFSVASAYSIYWFFGVLWDDFVGHVVMLVLTFGFVLLGYFVTRGLSYRVRMKLPVGSYALLLVLYLFMEVSCNLGHAMFRYADITWLHELTGWQGNIFSWDVPLVLSSLPIFGIALANLDADLSQERGAIPAAPVAPIIQPHRPMTAPSRPQQPKNQPVPSNPSNTIPPQPSYPTSVPPSQHPGQQGGYPSLPPLSPSQAQLQNGLGNYYNGKATAQMAMNGAQGAQGGN
jgi:hypothetical protein